MRLEETVVAANAEANRLAREECERVFGLSADALVACLRERERYQKHRARDALRELDTVRRLHSELWARYRRLARLLNRNGLLTADELREMR